MKYIHLPNDTGIEFDRYAAYILPIRDSFPLNIRQLVSDPKFCNLSSEETLHDANVAEIQIREIPSDRNLEISSSVSILESAGFVGGLSGGGKTGALDAFEINFPSEEYREGWVRG